MTKTILGAFLLLAAIALTASCSRSEQTEPLPSPDAHAKSEVETEQSQSASSELPLGRLDQAARPTHYELELRIDPREERFSGNVAIEVELETEMDGLWLHGNQLDVSESWIGQSSGSRIEAAYEQLHSSGVSRVTFEQPVGPGAFTLNLA